MDLCKEYLITGLLIVACCILRCARGDSCGVLRINNERVYVGDNIQLTLAATSWASRERIWWKVRAGGRWEEIYPSELTNGRIAESFYSGNYVLHISNVVAEDAGSITVSCNNRHYRSSTLSFTVETREDRPLDNLLIPPTQPEFVNLMNFTDCQHCIPATQGQAMDIECLSYNGSTPVTIKIFQNEKNVFSKEMLSYTNSWRKVVSAKIRITGSMYDMEADYRCTVINDALIVPREAVARLYSLKTPSTPLIINKNSMEGSTSGLVCSTFGGRPAPFLRFQYNDTVYQGKQEISYNPSDQTFSVRSRFDQVLSRYDNKRGVKCSAEYISVYKNSMINGSFTSLNVSFFPLSIQTEEVEVVRRDNGTTKLQLKCHVGESNPASNVKWKRLKHIRRSVGDVVTNRGRLGGWTVTQGLIVTLEKEDNGRMVECEAGNTMFPSLLKTAIYQAYITYSPLITIPEGFSKTVQVGEHVLITCVCDANPLATLRWLDGQNKTITAASSVESLVLEIESANNSHTGEYTCVAGNGRGLPRHLSVSLYVQDISKTDVFTGDSSETSDTTVGIIIAILVTILVIAIIAVFLIFYKKRKNNREKETATPVQIQYENRQPSIQPPIEDPVYCNVNRTEEGVTEQCEYAQVIPKSQRNKPQDTRKESQMNESGLLYVQLDLPSVESRRSSAQSRKYSGTKDEEDEAPTQYMSIDFTRTGKPIIES